MEGNKSTEHEALFFLGKRVSVLDLVIHDIMSSLIFAGQVLTSRFEDATLEKFLEVPTTFFVLNISK